MFYEAQLLQRKGKFGIVWIASCCGTKNRKLLSKREIIRVNVVQTCNDLMKPTVRLSLRLQANLLLGIGRVYKEQVCYLFNDLNVAWRKLQRSLLLDHLGSIDLDENKKSGNVTLPDPFKLYLNGDFETIPRDIFYVSPPNRDDDFFTISTSPLHDLNQADPRDITMNEPIKLDLEKQLLDFGEDILKPLDDLDPEIPDLLPEPIPEYVIGRAEDGDDNDVVQIIDAQTGQLTAAPEDYEKRKREDLETPSNKIDVNTREPPRKMGRRPRRQPIDIKTQLSAEVIRNNIRDVKRNVQDSLKHIVGAKIISVSELFKNPACPEIRVEPFLNLWKQNSLTLKITGEDIHSTPPQEPQESPRDGSDSQISPEIPRHHTTQSKEESDFEWSKDSLSGLDDTPLASAEISGPQVTALTPDPTRSRESSMSRYISTELPPIGEVPEIDLTDAGPLEPIDEVSQADDFENMFLRRVLEEIDYEDETTLSKVISHPINKRSTAKAFFQILVMHRNGVVNLEQDGFFQEIRIKKGHMHTQKRKYYVKDFC